MPPGHRPYTRSKKRHSHEPKSKKIKVDVCDVQQRPELSGPVNSTGFPILPTELLVEIISYFPSLPVPAKYQDLREEYRERAQTLHALTRLCRTLRRVFLPIMWERIEVLVKLRNDGKDTFFAAWKRPLATELVRQLEIVTVRDETLAAYVK
ncbi:hypothetical protein H0H81_009202 [Sphagnurus paluster]|uniref:Uncharacterized protein n=1 Tax=Sphagnurus paluster TaxID=117069 RepID=A0A9P7KK21_9AGAR|nr:hypothetical protein H0H81_009202 [Sphagnurus paluster]